MRRTFLAVSISAALAAGALPPVQAAPERTGDFALIDSHGRFHQLSRYQHMKAVAVMAYAPNCQDMAQALAAYNSLSDLYRPLGVEFLLINSNGETADDSSLPVLEDSSQLVSEALGLAYAGELRIINPQRLTMTYKGAPGPAAETSLAALLEGGSSRADTVTGPMPTRCALSFPARDQHKVAVPDYVADVAPLIIEKCTECHRQGGVGPFELNSYTALLGWSPMIREVLLNRRMPPTQIDTRVGHSPSARMLSDSQLQTLIHWFDAGAPRGDSTSDPLAALQPEPLDWVGGAPDLVLTAPKHAIPVSGLLDYVYADLGFPFPEERWLRAVQYKPQSVGTLHHLMAFITAPGEDFWGAEREQPAPDRRFLGAFAPGRPRLIAYPQDTGVRIPAGHRLSLQFHYIPNGLSGSDETQIGLYFSDHPPAHELMTAAVSARDFVIPAEVPEFPLQAEHLFSEDIVITAVRPRMGYRGKFMRFSLAQPGSTATDFFSVPAYNYGWQPDYRLAQPLRAPAGSRLILQGAFDNSISNPANPDPGQSVTSGFGREQESFTGYITYYLD